MFRQLKRKVEIYLQRDFSNIALRMDVHFLLNESRLLGSNARFSRSSKMTRPEANECFTLKTPNFPIILRILPSLNYSLTGKELASTITAVTPTSNASQLMTSQIRIMTTSLNRSVPRIRHPNFSVTFAPSDGRV